MEKKTAFSYKGQLAPVGDFTVNRLLPNRFSDAVGPFVFLDHMLPHTLAPKTPTPPDGKFAHPHRGFATFTYLLSGELEHFDSKGNHGIVGAGGAQWMKAGNGIIHDENPSPQFQQMGGTLQGMQFWINMPAANKAEDPAYKALQADDVPQVALPGGGMLRVLIGEYEGKTSPIETYTRQALYNIRLTPGEKFTMKVPFDFESAAISPEMPIHINGELHDAGEIAIFGIEGVEITFTNPGDKEAQIIYFGGEGYTEPIVAEGPFVMNTRAEIAEAYRDYFNKKYGTIDYKKI